MRTMKSPITKESLDMLIGALGVVAQNKEKTAEASFMAGAISLIASYMGDEGELVMSSTNVAIIVKEATLFALRGEEI